MTINNENIWQGAYKIPWNDAAFSRRMLAEHLSQDHDLASRRSEWIDRQVEWIHHEFFAGRPAGILDLGCGPGFYAHRLARLGHRLRGIDFGPASIEYASAHTPTDSQCEFTLADLREASLGGPWDLAMLLYGEFNVFAPAEIKAILRNVRDSLAPGGRLIIELQSPASIEQMGQAAPSEQRYDAGLFSHHRHTCRTENRWLPKMSTAVQTFTITEELHTSPTVYRSTTRAWSDEELARLLADVGFVEPLREQGWPSNNEALELWSTTVV